MSTENGYGNRALQALKTDLTANCEPIVYKMCVIFDVSQPYTPPQPVTGIVLLFIFILYQHSLLYITKFM
jgi:hypothetical protein